MSGYIVDWQDAGTIEILADPELTTITISPETATVPVGNTRQFTAATLDQYGDPIETVPVEWSVNGEGSIDQSGLYTAPNDPATDEISAMVDGVVGYATVTVSAAGNVDTQAILDAIAELADRFEALESIVLEVQAAVEDVSFGAVVVPLLGQIQSRTEGTTIRVYTQETTTITMAVVNAMGDPVDLDGMTLSLVIERAKGGDISVIEDGDIAVNESTISFAIPAEVSAAEGYHNWALRGSDGVVLMQGPLIVEYAPEVDQ